MLEVGPWQKLDEKSIGDGPKSPKRLLWPSRPLALRMIYFGITDNLKVTLMISFSVAERVSNWKRIRRDFFDPNNMRTLERYHIQIMSGFQFRVGLFDAGALMSIDTKHKLLRTITALQFIQEIIAKVRTLHVHSVTNTN